MSRSLQTPSVDVVLFDLGNTLLDYHTGGLSDDEKDLLGVRNMADLLHRWKVPVGFSELHDKFYLHWRERLRYRKRRHTEIDVEESLFRAVSSEVLPASRIRRLLLAFHEPSIRFCALHEGADEVLRDLLDRGKTLVLVANSPIPGYCHDAALQHLGIIDCFAARQYSYDVGVRKPDEKFFRRALGLVGGDASRAALVGDSWRLEIEPSLRLGMRTFWYVPPAERKKTEGRRDRRVRVVQRLTDMLPLIE